MEIKPIETVYNGYRFRSRLEARWAVFFDTLGIKYEYEKEGYEIKDRCSCKTWYYLPDFYLPETKTWVEVKGDLENVTVDYWAMLANAVDYGGQLPDIADSWQTERGILILSNIWIPSDKDIIIEFPCIQHSKGVHISSLAFFDSGLKFTHCYNTNLVDAGWGAEFAGTELKRLVSLNLPDGMWVDAFEGQQNNRVNIALKAALSARFEHGEKPDFITCATPIKNNTINLDKSLFNFPQSWEKDVFGCTLDEEWDDDYFTTEEFNEEWDRVMAREERHEKRLEEKLKQYSWVNKPDGIPDELFCIIMDEACSYEWWEGDVNEKIKDEWWSKIIEANRDNKAFNKAFYGENSFL
jgi:hypothetical protein